MATNISKSSKAIPAWKETLIGIREAIHRRLLVVTTFIVVTMLCLEKIGIKWAEKFTNMHNRLDDDHYGPSTDDFYTMVFFMVVHLMLREFFIGKVFYPLGSWFKVSEKKHARFAEQLYYAGYWACSFAFGVYTIHDQAWWFNTYNMWYGYPFLRILWKVKFLYILQGGFWLSGAIGHWLEKPRSDFWEMNLHHVATLLLIYFSYSQNGGSAVMVNMDLADIMLPTAKAFKYAGYDLMANIIFAIFLLTWFVTRLVFLPIMTWSTYVEMPAVVSFESYNPAAGHLFGYWSWVLYVTMLVILDILMVFWFYLIVRIAVRAVTSNDAEDDRSDDEDEQVEVEVNKSETEKPKKKRN